VPGEGLLALLLGGRPPGPQAALGDPEPAGHLGDRQALVGHQLHGLELELPGVGLARHRCSPPSESTPLTPTPRTLGKSSAARVDLDDVVTRSAPPPEDILAVDEAIDRLSAVAPQAAGLVKLRFFAGLTGEQAAALGVSPRTADALWAYARAWLFDHLGG
jgi:hypothetical protein